MSIGFPVTALHSDIQMMTMMILMLTTKADRLVCMCNVYVCTVRRSVARRARYLSKSNRRLKLTETSGKSHMKHIHKQHHLNVTQNLKKSQQIKQKKTRTKQQQEKTRENDKIHTKNRNENEHPRMLLASGKYHITSHHIFLRIVYNQKLALI